jgi:hypothetical protein
MECAAWDVLRVARTRGWYTVRQGETPTDEQLAIPVRSGRRAA